jgi:hypothetical protein
MPKNNSSINDSLFDLLKGKEYSPTMLSTAGKEIPTPDEAEVFQFNFVKDGEDYGKVTLSIDDSSNLIVYYSDDVADSEKGNGSTYDWDNFIDNIKDFKKSKKTSKLKEDDDEEAEGGELSWYGLLNQLKRFAQRYQLSFELKNTDKLKSDMAKRDYMKKQDRISENKQQRMAEGAPELLKAEMPLVRHIEQELAQNGVQKDDPEYNEKFKHAMAYYRKFGNIDAINKDVAEGMWKDIKRLATGKDAKSRAGQEIAKSQDANMRGDHKTSKKHFDRYDKLDKLANKAPIKKSSRWDHNDISDVIDDIFNEQGVAEGSVNDYFKRRKDEEDRIAGTKAPAKRTPKQTDYEKKRKEQGVAEGLEPKKRQRLDDLIDQYRDATDPSNDGYGVDDHYDPDQVIELIRQEFGDKVANEVEAGLDKMHFPRQHHSSGYGDSMRWKDPIDRITKAGKMYKQDSDYRKNTLKSRLRNAGKVLEQDVAESNQQVSEGYYPMGKQGSYSDAVPTTKIVIQHSRRIEEGEQRYRNIAKIFVENSEGERFAVPTNKPGLARVYARHIAEGGTPYDERGRHITSLVEEYSKMSGFMRATRGKQFNESAQQLVTEAVNYYQSLRESLSKMTGHRGYSAYFESWTPALMEDGEEQETNLNELFVQETLDPRIESVMPILNKLQKKVAEMREVDSLAEWADGIIDEATDLKSIPETSDVTAYDSMPKGRTRKDELDALAINMDPKNDGALATAAWKTGASNTELQAAGDAAKKIRAGQVGPQGAVGKLVGANESVNESEDELARILQMVKHKR